ncbi:MAG: GCN5-related N-acetyltransferase [Gemmatimonadetes bacterium]|nr:GCN5-related N-acetyltransferase [Gemmatimonadota bacterium]
MNVAKDLLLPDITHVLVRPLSGLRAIRLHFAIAKPGDAAAIASLRNAAAAALTDLFGRGHWSGETTERGVTFNMRHAQLWTAWRGRSIVGTFRLTTKKPWAIDRAYFARSHCPLYLTDMAISPPLQGQGIGRRCLARAAEIGRGWPADAIRLDAYDAEAGAGAFYSRCGFEEVGRVSYRGTPLVYYEQLIG